MTVADDVYEELRLTRSKSGLTATELAALIYGRRNNSYRQKVQKPLEQLEAAGRIEKLPKRTPDGQYLYRIPPEMIKRRKI